MRRALSSARFAVRSLRSCRISDEVCTAAITSMASVEMLDIALCSRIRRSSLASRRSCSCLIFMSKKWLNTGSRVTSMPGASGLAGSEGSVIVATLNSCNSDSALATSR